MPRYVLLMLNDSKLSDAEAAPVRAKMGGFVGELVQQGKFQAGHPLQAGAVRVREKGGRLVATDGPFAETKEMVGGFCVIEVADRNEAVEIAKRCPHAAVGPVEVREVMEVGLPPR